MLFLFLMYLAYCWLSPSDLPDEPLFDPVENQASVDHESPCDIIAPSPLFDAKATPSINRYQLTAAHSENEPNTLVESFVFEGDTTITVTQSGCFDALVISLVFEGPSINPKAALTPSFARIQTLLSRLPFQTNATWYHEDIIPNLIQTLSKFSQSRSHTLSTYEGEGKTRCLTPSSSGESCMSSVRVVADERHITLVTSSQL